MKAICFLVSSFTFFSAMCMMASASERSDRLSSLIKKSLEEKFNSAEIKLPSLEKMTESDSFNDLIKIKSVRLMDEKANGVVLIEVLGERANHSEIIKTVQTPFEAWIRVPVAIHRLYPNTKLKNEDFKIQSINVATGMAREYRGVMISAETNFNSMETKQSILEGQFVLTTAVRKQPDLRVGDSVKLELNSGDLSLTTQGIAQEAGFIGDRIRIMTIKTKREIMGILKADHLVEVNL